MRLPYVLLVSMIWTCAASGAWAQASEFRTAVDVEDALLTSGLLRAFSIQFEVGQSTLLPSSIPVLDAVGAVLSQHRELQVEIGGHTDVLGGRTTNQRLSEERALGVRNYLVARHGIAPERLVAVGYGESLPVASNATATGRMLNRRVEFRVLERLTPDESAVAQAPVSEDSLRAQIERAIREAIGATDPDADAKRLAALERRVDDLLDEIEREVAADLAPAHAAPIPRPPRRPALLPFTGAYLRGEAPVVAGLRLDLPTSLLGGARLQPEVAFAFGADDPATSVNANLVFPIRIGAETTPFLGAGIGFNNVESAQAVLNLVGGIEQRFDFGTLFADLMLQDFSSFTRIAIGFRQEL